MAEPDQEDRSTGPVLRIVGRVRSPLTELSDAPRQGDEGAPEAWIDFDPGVTDAARDLERGEPLVVLTWLDRGDREVLAVHPRDDANRPLTGVFSTRSPDRPNPVGLHSVIVREVEPTRIRVSGLEAIDGTPVIDIKPELTDPGRR